MDGIMNRAEINVENRYWIINETWHLEKFGKYICRWDNNDNNKNEDGVADENQR